MFIDLIGPNETAEVEQKSKESDFCEKVQSDQKISRGGISKSTAKFLMVQQIYLGP